MHAAGGQLLARRLHAAFRVQPTWRDLLYSVFAMLMYACLMLRFAQWSGLLATMSVDDAPVIAFPRLLLMSVRTLIAPALAEETLWRAMLMPHPRVERWVSWRLSAWSWGAQIVVSNACYVASHVGIGLLLAQCGRSGAAVIFADWRFLFCAAWLGTLCSALYYISGGCVWVPALVHATIVVIWLSRFGGEHVLSGGAAGIPTSV